MISWTVALVLLFSAAAALAEDAPSAWTMYYDSQRGIYGESVFTWDQFFTNLPAGESPEITNAAELESKGYAVDAREDGFTVRFQTGAAAQDATVSLHCGEIWHRMYLQAVNVQDLGQDMRDLGRNVQIVPGQEKARVGETITISAYLSESAAERYAEAHAQNAAFPELKDMLLRVQMDTQPEKTGIFVRGENGWQADVSLKIPYTQAAGEVQVSVGVTAGAVVIRDTGDYSIQIENQAPVLRTQINAEDGEIVLGGVPTEWSEVSILRMAMGESESVSLPEKLMETDSPLNLFEDPEGAPLTGTLMVETAEGSALPFGLFGAGKTDAWTMELAEESDQTNFDVLPGIRPVTYTFRITVSDGVNTSEELLLSATVVSSPARILGYVAVGLFAALLVLMIFLIVHRARKPRFSSAVRCLMTANEDAGECWELLRQSQAMPLQQFGKKDISLAHLLIMTRQPPLGGEYAEAAENITLRPARHGGICIRPGKKAAGAMGQVRKKEVLSQGSAYRIRLGGYSIYMENVG